MPTNVVPASADWPIYDSVVDPMTAAIRGALAGAGTEGAFLDKRDAAGVAEYYAEQGYTPVWTANGRLTDQAKAIIARIKNAEVDGLDPAAYRLPIVQLGALFPASLTATANADVELSDAIVTYARHEHSGRLDPSVVSPNFSYKPHLVDPLEVLASMVSASDPRRGADRLQPAASRVPGAARQARRNPQPAGGDAGGGAGRPDAEARRDRRARGGAARAAEDHRRGGRPQRLRPAGGGRGEGVADLGRAKGRRHDRQERAGAARHAAGQQRLHHPRQHGTLALDAGGPRAVLRAREHPELRPRHLPRRQGHP
ncbi:MAG: hypothetical protein WDM84_01305 [Bauldia sp.]